MDYKQFSEAVTRLSTLVVLDKVKEIGSIQSVALIGSSGSGKTTLVRAVRALNHPKLDIPKRYITRPQRQGDDLQENVPVTAETFDQMVQRDLMAPYWKRQMENGRVERYGFEKSLPGLFPIYSANNDFVRQDSSFSLNNTLVVGVFAPDATRRRRLLKRSPDLSESEICYRLGDSSYRIIPYCRVLIENYDLQEESAIQDCAALMSAIAEGGF